MIDLKFADHIEFEYTNYKGDDETRHVCIHRICWGVTEYHKQPQAILFGHCMDRRADRGFAVRDMRNVRRWSPFRQTTKEEWDAVNQRLAGTPRREEE